MFITAFVLLCPTLTRAESTNTASSQFDQIQSKLQSQLQGINFENQQLYVGAWILHIYNYQYTTGTYTLDMYVYFFWTDSNITTANWFFTNGYPIDASTKVLLSSNITGNIKYEFFRVTAVLATPPNAKNFPFDQITLKVNFEVITPGYAVNLAWLQNQTGIDPEFDNPDWKTTNVVLSTPAHSYPLGVVVPEAHMTITQDRIRQSDAIDSLFPPLIFCLVSGISFLFGLSDGESVALRLGLNSSMLITTILFLLSEKSSIPPSTSISIFSIFMISVITFLALNLVVTTYGYSHFIKFNDKKKIVRINRWGFIISIFLPLILFMVVFFLRP